MLAHTPLFQQALARPHTAVIRVRVRSGGQVLFDREAWRPDGTSVWFGGGSVRMNLSSRVTRTAKIAVAGRFYPTLRTDLFAPFGNELSIQRGIRYGDGTTEMFDVFTGPITSAAQRDDGMVDLSAADRAVWLLDNGFKRPWPVLQDSAGDEFKALVLDAVPDAVFAAMERFGQQLPAMSWESDRGKALDDVAKAVGAVWLCTADGRYTMMRLPWSTPDPSPLRPLRPAPAGTVLRALGRRSRDELFNDIAAFTERSDGRQAPMAAFAADTNPDSPTWTGGRFRRKTLMVEVDSATSPQQLQNVADDTLSRGLTWTEAFMLRMIPDPTVELGDAYLLDLPGNPSTQIVTSATMPLDVRSVASAETRSPAGVVV